MKLIYFIVTFIATCAGSLTGIGGGVIIKPVLDFLGDYPLETIGILSSASILTMALVNTYKNRKYVKQLDLKVILTLAGCSFIGGIIGKKLFYLMLGKFNLSEVVVGQVQSLLLVSVLIVVIILTRNKQKIKLKPIKSIALTGLVGLILGMLSSFLSIGGGPLNVIVLLIFWQLSQKEAAIGSITIIVFSQISSLSQTALTTDLRSLDLSMLAVMLPAAVLGGYMGSKLIHLFDEAILRSANIYMIYAIIGLNIYNLF